jgi:hypothetical protein
MVEAEAHSGSRKFNGDQHVLSVGGPFFLQNPRLLKLYILTFNWPY